MEKLPGDYIAGFVDGEGCFALTFRRDIKHNRGKRSGIKPVYFYWDIEFAIVLKVDDKQILERIRDTIGCGTVQNPNKNGSIRYSVQKTEDLLNKVLPFFEKYQLHAKKKFDFELWKEAVKIFKKNQRMTLNIRTGDRGFHHVNWDSKDLQRLKEIHEEMRKYKSRGKHWKWLK